MSDKFVISNMDEQEVESIAVQGAKQEGWDPGINDAKPFFAQDPHGFFKGELNNEVIGCCSSVIYDENFAFFGFYMVKQSYRHLGYGFQMTKHRLSYVGDKRNLGLDGVINMCDKYERIGFRNAHMNVRYQGKAIVSAVAPFIVAIAPDLFSKINVYDRLYFPAPRPKFLEQWLTPMKRQGFAYIKDGKVQGYGVIRQCFSGYKIGPLFADSYLIAEQLLIALLGTLKAGEDFY